MILDYDKQAVFTKSLDIVDIGNTAIRASSENGFDYYIVLKTIMGKTSILKFGPVMADMNVLLDEFNLSFQKIDYKEASILKALSLFVNDTKKKIAEVVELTEYEVFEALPDITASFNEGE